MMLGLLLLLITELGEPRFTHEDCRLVELRDSGSGQLVLGAEDLSMSADGRALLISAYDRQADMRGGVYKVGLPWPDSSTWQGENLAPGSQPQGLASLPSGGFVVIDRAGPGGPALLSVREGRQRRHSLSGEDREALCAGNDLAFGPDGRGAVTIEHEGCGGFLARAFAGRSGAVRLLSVAEGELSLGGEALEHLHLPNGITYHGGSFWAAEMRGRRLVSVGTGEEIALPGAPDNINASGEGIVAALQPSLWRFGLYRFGHRSHAPSRIVLVRPKEASTELVFEDRNGRFFAGATAAVLAGDVLVAGSVAGDRLLVCRAD